MLIVVTVLVVSCGSARLSSSRASNSDSVASFTASTTGVCWPAETRADGSAQRAPIWVAGVPLDPADPNPTPEVSVTSARRAAIADQPGAAAVRTILATVGPPYASVSQRAWVVIECNVPLRVKGSVWSTIGTCEHGNGSRLDIWPPNLRSHPSELPNRRRAGRGPMPSTLGMAGVSARPGTRSWHTLCVPNAAGPILGELGSGHRSRSGRDPTPGDAPRAAASARWKRDDPSSRLVGV
jgi:hypothetical protein